MKTKNKVMIHKLIKMGFTPAQAVITSEEVAKLAKKMKKAKVIQG